MNGIEISTVIIGIVGIVFTAVGAIEGLKLLWNLWRTQKTGERDIEHQISIPNRRTHSMQPNLDSPYVYGSTTPPIVVVNKTYVHVSRNNGDYHRRDGGGG
ncbi:hypothetical protein K440DRAFT_636302 [Wilcoxina mikolae CBS 423.85]|nr:hypothetical protein K440DRAFT_636302 [Wilcoxina mikolae CBS 423.85]